MVLPVRPWSAPAASPVLICASVLAYKLAGNAPVYRGSAVYVVDDEFVSASGGCLAGFALDDCVPGDVVPVSAASAETPGDELIGLDVSSGTWVDTTIESAINGIAGGFYQPPPPKPERPRGGVVQGTVYQCALCGAGLVDLPSVCRFCGSHNHP